MSIYQKTASGLLGTDGEQVEEFSLGELLAFHDHPFQVNQDASLEELKESIQHQGVAVPIIVRAHPTQRGMYEIIAGHRRVEASRLLGRSSIPGFIRELDDQEAVLFMVDTNIQREELRFSEKAFAYKMKLEALKQQGKRTDLTSDPLGQKLEMGDESTSDPLGQKLEMGDEPTCGPLGHKSEMGDEPTCGPLGHKSEIGDEPTCGPLGHKSEMDDEPTCGPLGHKSKIGDEPTSGPLGHKSEMGDVPTCGPLGHKSKIGDEPTCGPLGHKKSRDDLAENSPDSARNIQRYIRLTELIRPFLDMVDEKKLAFQTAVELSYLNQAEQKYLLQFMAEEGVKPTLLQASALKEASQQGGVTAEKMRDILLVKEVKAKKVSLRGEVRGFFPEETSDKEMEKVIVQLLQQWKENQD